MNKILLLLSSVILAIILNSCIPVAIGSSATTGLVLAKEKSFGTTFDDIAIKTKINNDLLQKDINNLFARVNVKVSEGKVLLTGSVNSPEERLEAIRIAWAQKGVKEVINEIQIEDKKNNEFGIGDYSKDTWITTQLKTKMLLNQKIRSVNYNLETIKGVVYLIGIAQSQEELDLVNAIASQTKFVKKVVNYVRIKDPYENEPVVEPKREHRHKKSEIEEENISKNPAPRIHERRLDLQEHKADKIQKVDIIKANKIEAIEEFDGDNDIADSFDD